MDEITPVIVSTDTDNTLETSQYPVAVQGFSDLECFLYFASRGIAEKYQDCVLNKVLINKITKDYKKLMEIVGIKDVAVSTERIGTKNVKFEFSHPDLPRVIEFTL